MQKNLETKFRQSTQVVGRIAVKLKASGEAQHASMIETKIVEGNYVVGWDLYRGPNSLDTCNPVFEFDKQPAGDWIREGNREFTDLVGRTEHVRGSTVPCIRQGLVVCDDLNAATALSKSIADSWVAAMKAGGILGAECESSA